MFQRTPPAGPDDWFRSPDWSPAARARFEEKLGRARDRAQYLRIKGLALTEAGDAERGRAGAALLQRLIDDHPQERSEVAGAHALLASWHEREGRLDEAVAEYRATLAAEIGTNTSNGAELALAALIARAGLRDGFPEAERLLDLVAGGHGALVFRAQQYTYAVARSRIAAEHGRRDEAAAYAMGALWLVDANAPMAARHPDVGLIDERSAGGDRDALAVVAAAGDPEMASPLIEQFRGDDGRVRWEWGLTRRLRESVSTRHEDAAPPVHPLGSPSPMPGDRTGGPPRRRLSAGPRAAVLAELRAAGFDVFDLATWNLKTLKTIAEVRVATPILLRALAGPDEGDTLHWNVLNALADRRARGQATVPMIELFPKAVMERNGLAVAVGNNIASFARDEHLDLLAPLLADPRLGHDRTYLWWAVGFMTSERAVDLALEHLGDEEVWNAVLRALCDMKSERAEPSLRALAAQEPVPLTRKQTQYWLRDEEPDAFVVAAERRNLEIEIATRGLAKLEKARAAGKSRHAA